VRRGATRAYLQVEETAAAALSLYASAGFETRYAYHYRSR
jgi:ribosomal protein S18 acetylase RimI-like enzyme